MRKKHGELFHRMQLDLGCGEQWTVTPTEQMLAQIKETGPTPLFLEQLHAMGRYLLISSCGKFPPSFTGNMEWRMETCMDWRLRLGFQS